jgi:predicted nuclease of predicted toxin-antitoxin system
MRLLLDENLDWRLGRDLPGHQTESVSSLGWTGIQNGELLAEATEAGFDALVTMDPPSLGFGVAGQQHGAPAEHRQIRNRRRCSTSALESIG